MSYYKLLQAMRNKEEKVPDNDIKYFKTRIQARKREIIPSDFYFDQYYLRNENCNYFSIHNDIMNFVDYEENGFRPSKYRSVEQVIDFQKNGRNYNQPIFNDDLLNEIDQNNVKVIYSNRK